MLIDRTLAQSTPTTHGPAIFMAEGGALETRVPSAPTKPVALARQASPEAGAFISGGSLPSNPLPAPSTGATSWTRTSAKTRELPWPPYSSEEMEAYRPAADAFKQCMLDSKNPYYLKIMDFDSFEDLAAAASAPPLGTQFIVGFKYKPGDG